MKLLFNELKNYKISLLLILVFTYISTTFELMIPLLLANALNVGIIENYGMSYISSIVIAMIFFILISIILNTITHYIINKISIYSSSNIKNNLFKSIINSKPNQLNHLSTSSLLTRTTSDIDQIRGFISSFLGTIFKAPILLINCITVLKTLNSNFSFLIIIAIALLLIYFVIIIIKLFPISKQIQSKTDELNKTLKEKISNIRILKSYNNLNNYDKQYEKVNEEYVTSSNKIIALSSYINPILNLLINSIVIIILALSINLAKNNTLYAGTVFATIQYILQIIMAIIMLSMITLLIPKAHVSISRINKVLKDNNINQNNQTNKLEINNIVINNLSFHTKNKEILKNINLTIKPGESIGIIGPTGSGKSTLAKLMIKDLKVQNDSIFINDNDINYLSRNDILTNIIYLPQTSTIMSGTVLENIMFANTSLQKEEIALIVHTANLSSFLINKKEKLNYVLEENGSNLSSGQKQRICLARVLASKAKLIILDEPFSALDYKTEKEIINNLNTYYKHKTFITISQRISSIKHCNKIVVMNEGQILDIGNHDYLIKNNDTYKEMYETQKEVIEYDI